MQITTMLRLTLRVSIISLVLVGVPLVVVYLIQGTTPQLEKAVAKQPGPALASASNKGQSQNQQKFSLYEYTMDDIDGKPVALDRFKGQVVMVVNTASFCGNTPQYGGLQTLYERYRDQGFTILAFPANDFGKQEPGTNTEIAEFCYTKYSLEFPLFSKITVLGENKHPLYRSLTEETLYKGEIKWNFQKFLINRHGQVVARYRPGMKPLSEKIVQDIEVELAKT